MVLLYWLIFAIILGFAWIDCKRTIIVWMPLQLLFNDMVALKYTSPILTLSIAINFILPLIFLYKYILKNKRTELTNEPFFFNKVFVLYLISGEFYQFNLSSCIRQQNSLTAQFVSFSLSNLANIFYPPQFLQ